MVYIPSNMNNSIQKNTNFLDIYSKTYRLVAAVFVISDTIEQGEEIRARVRKLSLELVSLSVNIKDAESGEVKGLIKNIERNSLELLSMLDIASITGLISKMNASIIKEEFQSFISEINDFASKFEYTNNASIKSVFTEPPISIGVSATHSGNFEQEKIQNQKDLRLTQTHRGGTEIGTNGHRRKDTRRSTIFEFIKGHNNVGIKDIASHIVGCSEKTVQREITQLINEGKIKKTGERRWSRYYI